MTGRRPDFVEIEGFEPSLTEPESVVLPLHHISISVPFFRNGTANLQLFSDSANFSLSFFCDFLRLLTRKQSAASYWELFFELLMLSKPPQKPIPDIPRSALRNPSSHLWSPLRKRSRCLSPSLRPRHYASAPHIFRSWDAGELW